MTPKEFAEKMRELNRRYDADNPNRRAHFDSEAYETEVLGLMCDALRKTGYAEGVNMFRR